MRNRSGIGMVGFLAAMGAMAACGTDSPGVRDGLLTGEVEQLVIEVHYQADAPPHTGSGRAWELTRVNLEALVSAAQVAVVVPQSVSEMHQLPAASGADYSSDDLLGLLEGRRVGNNTGSQRVFYVLLVDGYFADAGGRQENVLGVSLGDTGVVALFERVISASGVTPVPTFVEQSTLIHEIGHAVGLVNNGVPMVTDHQDAAHGNHCDNPDCVMVHQNEGAADLADFVRRLRAGNPVIYGPECLADAHALAQ